ncbi:MAG TPA: cytochrome c oxidase subunit I, partial [Myxococcota bacterium]|nr:cytochrome c oxidase subunit I [Myxococcota bacterium]
DPERHLHRRLVEILNVISTVGSWALAGGLGLTVVYLTHALLFGRPAPDNPWASRCFEWRTASPPPPENFHGALDITPGAYDYTLPPGGGDA